MPADKPTELSRIKLKTWTRRPVPMISKHSAHSTSLPVGFRTWLWRYTCLLLLILMLWYRHLLNVGFEPRVSNTKSPADLMPADKPIELSRIKLKTWTRQPVSPMISEPTASSPGVKQCTFHWLIPHDIPQKEMVLSSLIIHKFSIIIYDYMHQLWNYVYYISTKIINIAPL